MNRIKRWKQHFQSLPRGNRIGAILCLAVLIVCIIALVNQIAVFVTDCLAAAPANPAAIRGRVWDKTQPLLEQADHQAAQALDKHLAAIHAFLDERKAGSRAFAEKLVSFQGKWEIIRAQIGNDSDYAQFLKATFDEHLFPMEELEKAVHAAVASYLHELESIDDDLLVQLRADIADEELLRLAVPGLRSTEALRRHYHELSQRVSHDLTADLAVFAGRELFLWHAANIATDLTLQTASAIAARLGVSSTILGAGAASSWRTLGVGLVVAFVLDEVVNRLIKLAGYDLEEKIAQRVEQTLTDLGRTITDGDPEARATLEKLKTMQADDPDPEVRATCAPAIAGIEAGNQLHGLRRELTKIGNARASLRKETLRRLIHESE